MKDMDSGWTEGFMFSRTLVLHVRLVVFSRAAAMSNAVLAVPVDCRVPSGCPVSDLVKHAACR